MKAFEGCICVLYCSEINHVLITLSSSSSSKSLQACVWTRAFCTCRAVLNRWVGFHSCIEMILGSERAIGRS